MYARDGYSVMVVDKLGAAVGAKEPRSGGNHDSYAREARRAALRAC